jgi:thioredoxin reductase (NADPH)
MTSMYEKPTRAEALKYYRRVAEHYKLDIHQYEQVDAIDGVDGAFTIPTTDRHGAKHCYRAKTIVVSTGYYDVPNLLGVPGEELSKVIHYYKEPHPYYDHDVLVVGAKNSAAIAALELYWTGARVTLVHRGPAMHKHVKYWIKPNIENRITNGEVKAYFNSRVTEILPTTVRIQTPEGNIEIPNDFVFAMIGYSPDLKFLNANGIVLEPETLKPRTDAKTLESDRKGIYLAGVIVAGMHTNEVFIENGRFHGRQIADAIAGLLS